MNKIQRVSLFFRVLFQTAFIALPLLLAFAWVHAPQPLQLAGNEGASKINVLMDVIPSGTPILHVISSTTKLYGFLISMIPGGIGLVILYFLIQLFRLYEKGEIFSLQNVRYIRNIGYTLLIGQLLNPIYDGLITLVLTWNNPAGHRFASITFGSTNIGILLLSILVILISWIMAEGCKLREEQQLTV